MKWLETVGRTSKFPGKFPATRFGRDSKFPKEFPETLARGKPGPPDRKDSPAEGGVVADGGLQYAWSL